MTDLAVLVPSRGRPANVARLAETCAKTCRTDYRLTFGFDEDDPHLTENIDAASGYAGHTERPRMGLAAWTNYLAASASAMPYLASIGDDMVPITDGWDEQLITAIEHMGGGYAYPDDRRRNDIPEACVISTSIVRALGWMCLPTLDHWYVDSVWGDIGRAAQCIAYCNRVVVEHRHPVVTGQPGDATYSDAARSFDKDSAAYRHWRLYQMPKDIAVVRACLNRPA